MLRGEVGAEACSANRRVVDRPMRETPAHRSESTTTEEIASTSHAVASTVSDKRPRYAFNTSDERCTEGHHHNSVRRDGDKTWRFRGSLAAWEWDDRRRLTPRTSLRGLHFPRSTASAFLKTVSRLTKKRRRQNRGGDGGGHGHGARRRVHGRSRRPVHRPARRPCYSILVSTP